MSTDASAQQLVPTSELLPAVVRDSVEREHAFRELEQRVAERTHELETLLAVAQSVASTLELPALLTLVLD